jgi:hypothetical protein
VRGVWKMSELCSCRRHHTPLTGVYWGGLADKPFNWSSTLPRQYPSHGTRTSGGRSVQDQLHRCGACSCCRARYLQHRPGLHEGECSHRASATTPRVQSETSAARASALATARELGMSGMASNSNPPASIRLKRGCARAMPSSMRSSAREGPIRADGRQRGARSPASPRNQLVSQSDSGRVTWSDIGRPLVNGFVNISSSV